MVITPNFTSIYHFLEERVVENRYKSCCLRLKGGRRILKSVFAFFANARYKFYESRSNSS